MIHVRGDQGAVGGAKDDAGVAAGGRNCEPDYLTRVKAWPLRAEGPANRTLVVHGRERKEQEGCHDPDSATKMLKYNES
jgi:hypothetical protein